LQERDYVTAATSAKHIARLVQIETEVRGSRDFWFRGLGSGCKGLYPAM